MLLALPLAAPFAAGALPRAAGAAGAQIDAGLYGGLRWRMIGPFRAGRVNGVSGVPGQPNTFYFGSVGGGVWKTTNAGRTWTPIFDCAAGRVDRRDRRRAVERPTSSTSAPARPTCATRSQFGNGMYKSIDAGKTWTHIGLETRGRSAASSSIRGIPNIVFVAALGHVYGANPDRGVYRSKDGGATWQKVLYKGNDIGAIDVAFDPSNPQTVYASLWNTRRPPWFIYAPSNGPGSGLFKSDRRRHDLDSS